MPKGRTDVDSNRVRECPIRKRGSSIRDGVDLAGVGLKAEPATREGALALQGQAQLHILHACGLGASPDSLQRLPPDELGLAPLPEGLDALGTVIGRARNDAGLAFQPELLFQSARTG